MIKSLKLYLQELSIPQELVRHMLLDSYPNLGTQEVFGGIRKLERNPDQAAVYYHATAGRISTGDNLSITMQAGHLLYTMECEMGPEFDGLTFARNVLLAFQEENSRLITRVDIWLADTNAGSALSKSPEWRTLENMSYKKARTFIDALWSAQLGATEVMVHALRSADGMFQEDLGLTDFREATQFLTLAALPAATREFIRNR